MWLLAIILTTLFFTLILFAFGWICFTPAIVIHQAFAHPRPQRQGDLLYVAAECLPEEYTSHVDMQ